MSLPTVGLDLFQLRAPAPNRSYRDRAVELDHVTRRRERIEHTAYVRMPHASVEVEIMSAISSLSLLRAWGLGGEAECTLRLPGDGAEEKRNCNDSEQVSNVVGFGLYHACSVGLFSAKALHVWHRDFQRKIKARLRQHIGLAISRFIPAIACSREVRPRLLFNPKPSTLSFAWFEGQSTWFPSRS